MVPAERFRKAPPKTYQNRLSMTFVLCTCVLRRTPAHAASRYQEIASLFSRHHNL